MKSKDLFIFDYSDCLLHTYRVEDSITVDDSFISKLGFKLSNVSWMVGNIKYCRHPGVLI